MNEENIYGLSDEVLDRLEKEVSHAEIDAETSEDFIDKCFPNLSVEDKAKASMFAEKFAELFMDFGDEE